jgi:hypothetical protein
MTEQLPNFDSTSSFVSYSFHVLPISQITERATEVQELQKQNLKTITLLKKIHWQLPRGTLNANILFLQNAYTYIQHTTNPTKKALYQFLIHFIQTEADSTATGYRLQA